MESYFHRDHLRKTCITAYPTLVTESQKYAKSHDFWEKRSHIWSVVLRRPSLHVCGLFCREFDKKAWKRITTYLATEVWYCRDIALRYTAHALARVILITSLISANQMLCMIIWFRNNLSTRTVCILGACIVCNTGPINHLKLFLCCTLLHIDFATDTLFFKLFLLLDQSLTCFEDDSL